MVLVTNTKHLLSHFFEGFLAGTYVNRPCEFEVVGRQETQITDIVDIAAKLPTSRTAAAMDGFPSNLRRRQLI
jgi:hypothetical protein